MEEEKKPNNIENYFRKSAPQTIETEEIELSTNVEMTIITKEVTKKNNYIKRMKKNMLKPCKHGQEKRTCTHCKEYRKCEHGRRKRICVACSGSGICEHKRRRGNCKLCNGSQICQHKRIKAQCVQCKGSKICEHGHRKNECVACGGSLICTHGHQKYTCVHCKGSQVCEHGHRKYKCVKCGGSEICEHGRQKYGCAKCGNGLCKDCNLFSARKKTNYLCSYCHPMSKSRLKYDESRPEIKVMKFIQQHVNVFLHHDAAIGGSCNTKERPDIVLPYIFKDASLPIVVIEVDENHHASYNTLCDWKRVFNIASSLVQLEDIGSNELARVVFIRFNPDTWRNSFGTIMRVDLQEKMEKLLALINEILEDKDNNQDMLRMYHMYYPGDKAIVAMSNAALEEKLNDFI